MRRLVRVILALVVLAALASAGYAAYWYAAAGQMRAAIAGWAARNGDLEVRTGAVAVTGFPDRLIATIDGIEIARRQGELPGTYTAEAVRVSRALRGSTTVVSLTGPHTLSYTVDGQAQTLRARADLLAIELRSGKDGAFAGFGLSLAGLNVQRPALQPLTVRRLTFNFGVGSGIPGVINDRSRFTMRMEGLTLPEHRRGPLGDTLAQVTFNAIWTQPLASLDLPVALARWRDANGYITFTEVAVKWGTLDMTNLGSGVLKLDAQMRPTGGMNAGLVGYQNTVDAFHAARLLTDEARAQVQAALTFLGQRAVGQGGRLGLPLDISDGKLSLGPATLGTVKPILP
jgi:hypothetical protein